MYFLRALLSTLASYPPRKLMLLYQRQTTKHTVTQPTPTKVCPSELLQCCTYSRFANFSFLAQVCCRSNFVHPPHKLIEPARNNQMLWHPKPVDIESCWGRFAICPIIIVVIPPHPRVPFVSETKRRRSDFWHSSNLLDSPKLIIYAIVMNEWSRSVLIAAAQTFSNKATRQQWRAPITELVYNISLLHFVHSDAEKTDWDIISVGTVFVSKAQSLVQTIIWCMQSSQRFSSPGQAESSPVGANMPRDSRLCSIDNF